MTPSQAQHGLEGQRAALEAVLGSKTFEKSEQLKGFLRYVCEKQWGGRAGELTEYSIGVDVLGRGAAFSPHEDSIVRNRAYALRKKLEEYYEGEAVGDQMRIELPKGAYAPRFVEAREPVEKPIADLGRRRFLGYAATGAAGVGLGAAGMRWMNARRLRAEVPPAVRRFWAPMLDARERVMLCVGTPPQSFLRTFPVPNIHVPGTMVVDAETQAWHAKQKVEVHGPYLFQVPTLNSPLWGDAAGTARVVQLLAQQGVETEVVAERLVALPALRNRNAVFLGTSEYSGAVARLLKGLAFGIRYDEEAEDHIALQFDAGGKVVKKFPVKRIGGTLSEVYGLVTRVKGDGDGEKSTTYIVLSGVSSAGILAAAEFATSAHHLEELEKRSAIFPERPLQVLVKVTTDKTLPLSFEYLTHWQG